MEGASSLCIRFFLRQTFSFLSPAMTEFSPAQPLVEPNVRQSRTPVDRPRKRLLLDRSRRPRSRRADWCVIFFLRFLDAEHKNLTWPVTGVHRNRKKKTQQGGSVPAAAPVPGAPPVPGPSGPPGAHPYPPQPYVIPEDHVAA